MDLVEFAVANAQTELRQRLEAMLAADGLTRDVYVRYLSMQYHLTQGVQRHFMAAAGHPDMAARPKFRDFLIRLALDEEPHHAVAMQDLKSLGQKPMPAMLDVKLWWAYFNAIDHERPFVRLGAMCILENIAGGAGPILEALSSGKPFLSPKTTRFLRLRGTIRPTAPGSWRRCPPPTCLWRN